MLLDDEIHRTWGAIREEVLEFLSIHFEVSLNAEESLGGRGGR